MIRDVWEKPHEIWDMPTLKEQNLGMLNVLPAFCLESPICPFLFAFKVKYYRGEAIKRNKVHPQTYISLVSGIITLLEKCCMKKQKQKA